MVLVVDNCLVRHENCYTLYHCKVSFVSNIVCEERLCSWIRQKTKSLLLSGISPVILYL